MNRTSRSSSGRSFQTQQFKIRHVPEIGHHPTLGGGPGGACGHAGVQNLAHFPGSESSGGTMSARFPVVQGIAGGFVFSGSRFKSRAGGFDFVSPGVVGIPAVRADWKSSECHACKAALAMPTRGASCKVSLQRNVICSSTRGPPTSWARASTYSKRSFRARKITMTA